MLSGKLFFALLSVSLVYASPLKSSQGELDAVSASSAAPSAASSDAISVTSVASSAAPSASGAPVGTIDDPALSQLLDGNKEFKSSSKLSLAQNLTADGPDPPFMILECADNRVTAGTILHATLGTIFGHHNLGNLYSQNDTNANAALVYGVEELGVKHIIVMGHYGCPTVGTALMGNSTAVSKSKKKSGEEPNSTHNHSAPEVDAWIQPIRQLYLSSNRTEIVALRDNKTALTEVPDASNLGFRALVEENVKASVARIRKDSILAKIYQTQAGSSSSVVVSSTKVSSSGASSATFVESTGASSSTIEKSAKPSGSVSSSKAKSAAPPSKSVSPRAKAKSASAQPSSSIMYSSVKPSAASGFAASPTPTGHTTDGQDQIDVFVHGFVYDMETGDVFNLGVTFGPPGRILPKVPFSAVASATQALKSAHSASNTVSASATH